VTFPQNPESSLANQGDREAVLRVPLKPDSNISLTRECPSAEAATNLPYAST